MYDFGKNVIPFYIKSGDNVYAYHFSGYWKDVGTIDSLWRANMEFIDDEGGLDIRDKNWRIYSKNPIAPPQFITEKADVENSMIVDGCFISGSQAQHPGGQRSGQRGCFNQGFGRHDWCFNRQKRQDQPGDYR